DAGHRHRPHGRVPPLVPHLPPRPVERLVHGVSGHHPEHDGDTGLGGDGLDPPGGLSRHELEMGGLPADHRPQADDGVELPAHGPTPPDPTSTPGGRFPETRSSSTTWIPSNASRMWPSFSRFACRYRRFSGVGAVSRGTRSAMARPYPSSPARLDGLFVSRR